MGLPFGKRKKNIIFNRCISVNCQKYIIRHTFVYVSTRLITKCHFPMPPFTMPRGDDILQIIIYTQCSVNNSADSVQTTDWNAHLFKEFSFRRGSTWGVAMLPVMLNRLIESIPKEIYGIATQCCMLHLYSGKKLYSAQGIIHPPPPPS